MTQAAKARIDSSVNNTSELATNNLATDLYQKLDEEKFKDKMIGMLNDKNFNGIMANY